MSEKVVRIDCRKNRKYNRIWVDAETIEEAMKITGIKNIVDYCKLEIKEL